MVLVVWNENDMRLKSKELNFEFTF
jgi:hypothetical protein